MNFSVVQTHKDLLQMDHVLLQQLQTLLCNLNFNLLSLIVLEGMLLCQLLRSWLTLLHDHHQRSSIDSWHNSYRPVAAPLSILETLPHLEMQVLEVLIHHVRCRNHNLALLLILCRAQMLGLWWEISNRLLTHQQAPLHLSIEHLATCGLLLPHEFYHLWQCRLQ